MGRITLVRQLIFHKRGLHSFYQCSIAHLCFVRLNLHVLSSLISAGDIMGGCNTSVSIAGSYTAMERVVLSANGNLQRIMRWSPRFIHHPKLLWLIITGNVSCVTPISRLTAALITVHQYLFKFWSVTLSVLWHSIERWIFWWTERWSTTILKCSWCHIDPLLTFSMNASAAHDVGVLHSCRKNWIVQRYL